MSSILFSQRVSVPADVLVQELQGEAVILNINSGRYFGLDETGNRMLTVLKENDSIEAAHAALLGEYEVDGEQLRRDLQDFIKSLVDNGLVEVGG